nr:tetratricopeptide repeat protein [Ramlibacter aurantiacus]
MQQAGDWDQARRAFEDVLSLDPVHADALWLLGAMLHDQADYEASRQCLDRAVALRPHDAAIRRMLGAALVRLKQTDAALEQFDLAIELKPDLAAAHASRATTLHRIGRVGEAVAGYDRGIELAPDCADYHVNRGAARQDLDQQDLARADYDRAIALEPRSHLAFMNRGTLWHELGHLARAQADFDRALEIEPGHPETLYNKACTHLIQGQWAQGWAMLDARWKLEANRHRVFDRPVWTGQPIEGRTVLLQSEQGLGDTLMLARFAREVTALGGRVLLQVQPPLRRVLSRLEGVDELFATSAASPPHDWFCPLFTLPHALGVNLQTVPGRGGYLEPEPELVRQWDQRLGPREGLRVGLVWSGNPRHRNDHRRSIPLQRILRALPDDCEPVSLHKEVREADAPFLGAHPRLRHFGSQLGDLADTAALCAHMDLVLTVDSCVAHLAGALGRPTWILLPVAPDYRWLREGEDCPWYASARLWRQGPDRDWEPVLQRVRQGLEQRLSRGACPPRW